MAVPGVKMKEQKRKDMIASDSSLPERATDRGNQAMTPLDPDYAARVQTSFSRQQAMTLLDAEMIEVLATRHDGDRAPISARADATTWLCACRHHHGSCRFCLWLCRAESDAPWCGCPDRCIQGQSPQRGLGQTLLGARAGGEAWADDDGLHRRGDGGARPHRSLG
jgi:hypothetical protein